MSLEAVSPAATGYWSFIQKWKILFLRTILRYLLGYFPFSVSSSTTFQMLMLYIELHYIFLTATVSAYLIYPNR